MVIWDWKVCLIFNWQNGFTHHPLFPTRKNEGVSPCISLMYDNLIPRLGTLGQFQLQLLYKFMLQHCNAERYPYWRHHFYKFRLPTIVASLHIVHVSIRDLFFVKRCSKLLIVLPMKCCLGENLFSAKTAYLRPTIFLFVKQIKPLYQIENCIYFTWSEPSDGGTYS